MSIRHLNINKLLVTILSVLLIVAGCKKDTDKDVTTAPVFTELPDSVMFVTTLDSVTATNLGKTIYVLNASTGSLTTKYHYPFDAKTTWSYPAAGNGFLYNLENNKINAINMNTGEVLWTDTINNYSIPVLHDDIFYGIYEVNSTSYFVYALDATKPGKDFLWKYELIGGLRSAFPTVRNQPLLPMVRYYNGTIYFEDGSSLIALDATTGVLKWKISSNNNSSFSLAALNNGIIMLGNTAIDAASGANIWSAPPLNIPPVYGAQTVEQDEIVYANKEFYFVKTYHFNSPNFTSFLSAVNSVTKEYMWTVNFGGGISWDTDETVEQAWDKHLVTKKSIKSISKYGTSVAEIYKLLDINSGSMKLDFDDPDPGNTFESFIVNNTMYFHKIFIGLGPGNYPTENYLSAIDLFTGKEKWNINELLAGYNGSVFSCVFTGGKGYSPFIQ